MKSGWLNPLVGQHLLGRRKATLCAVLSVLWVFPSIGALWILWMHWPVWADASTAFEAIEGTRLEQWVAGGLLLAQACFVFLAIHYARHEQRLRQDDDAIEPLADKGPGIGQ